MSDLIKRGRDWADCLDCADVPLVNALCDEIERLNAELFTMRNVFHQQDEKIERLTGERDRQYDQNVEQIAGLAQLEAKVETLADAIGFALHNASNSFMGVNFQFEAVKKLREAVAQGGE